MIINLVVISVSLCFIGSFVMTAEAVKQCPKGCECVEQSVRCIRLQLTDLPEVSLDTNILDLRYNHIRQIPTNSFASLLHVHTIFLNENHISKIEASSFHGLAGSLKYLYLNKNRITHISSDAFQGLNHLNSLYLQNNELSEFSAETFSNLNRLEVLYLYSNNISKIPFGSFQNMPALKRLRIDSNPIKCDCSAIWLGKMLKQNSHIQSAITCKTPSNLSGKTINNLIEDDFKCQPPQIMDEPNDVMVDMSGTAIFTCHAEGDPKPQIVWLKNSNEIPLSDPRYHLLADGTLKIENVDNSILGQYECVAKNEMGEMKSRSARMAIKQNEVYLTNDDDEQPSRPIIINPFRDLTVPKNDRIVLDCQTEGIPEPQIIWYFNGQPLSQSTATSRIYENGTLIVHNANLNNSGLYKCEAVNFLGSVFESIVVKINVAPQITLAPQSKTIESGTNVLLECEAVGYPAPKIWWKYNEQPLIATNRIVFGAQNTKLNIKSIEEGDSGQYICVAENTIGTVEAIADIFVQNTRRPPKLIFEPYDIDAIPGSSIELPCQADDTSNNIHVKWQKDGKTIVASSKHRIVSSGSLYIKKITDQDAGRYECSIKNQYGRATASGLVTVRNNEVLTPGDRYVRIAYAEASHDIDNAINQTISSLFGGGGKKNGTASDHGDLFKKFRYPNAPTRELARAAEIYERTLLNIRKHVDQGLAISGNLSDFNYKDILSAEHLNLIAELSGCQAHRIIPNCTNMCYHMKYRSIDGTCNNLQNPSWGASLTGFRRLLKPIYENGFSMPIGWTKGRLYYGFPKPSARLVSTSVISTKVITQDEQITHMVMQWGQFLDHDLDHAIPSVSSESWDGIDCKKSCEYAAPCYPIEVPENDPRVKNRRCIDLVRSSAICGSGMTSVLFDTVQPREQINQLTSYIDASQVYGFSRQFSLDLRNLTSDDGLLRTGVSFPNQKSMLPFAAPTDGIDCRRDVAESNVNCFAAGDIRVNEQIGLAAMHTIWLREHNRIAQELKEINPHWDGETLYQESRKIVGAEMQHITYTHWLPNVLGEVGMNLLGNYKEYDPTVNPSISNEFATAALRFGHTLINPILHRLNETFEPIEQGHLPLHKAFFSPWRLVYEGGVDPLLRGMFSVAAKLKMPTENLNTELTEKLFLTAHAVALDLAAINIQRSRDHGIPGYNEYRRICNLKVAETFDDLKGEISNDLVREKLKELYGHPGNIDIFVGGILEDQIDGARIGPVFRCILIEQFNRLRNGDRHWYENAATFRSDQLSQIKMTSLARILCDNGDNITKITDNVFHLPGIQGGYKECSQIPKVNLGFWLNCDKCSAHPDPNLPRPVDPTTRQRRKRNIDNNATISDNSSDSTFTAMTEERIEGLESLIDTFEKTIKQMRKRLKKLEQSCTATNGNVNALKNKGRPHVHCVDEAGNRRLNNEIWSKDECTRCECKSRQITCIQEKCSQLKCLKNEILTKNPGECCAVCQENKRLDVDLPTRSSGS